MSEHPRHDSTRSCDSRPQHLCARQSGKSDLVRDGKWRPMGDHVLYADVVHVQLRRVHLQRTRRFHNLLRPQPRLRRRRLRLRRRRSVGRAGRAVGGGAVGHGLCAVGAVRGGVAGVDPPPLEDGAGEQDRVRGHGRCVSAVRGAPRERLQAVPHAAQGVGIHVTAARRLPGPSVRRRVLARWRCRRAILAAAGASNLTQPSPKARAAEQRRGAELPK